MIFFVSITLLTIIIMTLIILYYIDHAFAAFAAILCVLSLVVEQSGFRFISLDTPVRFLRTRLI